MPVIMLVMTIWAMLMVARSKATGRPSLQVVSRQVLSKEYRCRRLICTGDFFRKITRRNKQPTVAVDRAEAKAAPATPRPAPHTKNEFPKTVTVRGE